MSSHQNPLADLHTDSLAQLLRQQTGVVRTGRWLDGSTATTRQLARARQLVRNANLALLARNDRVAL